MTFIAGIKSPFGRRGTGRSNGCTGWQRPAAVMAAALAIGLTTVLPSAAQRNASTGGKSYITPFPKNEVYRLRAYGDYFADGIAYGLSDAFKRDKRVSVINGHGRIRAIVRRSFDAALKSHLADLDKNPVPIVVLMIGGDDNASIRYNNGARVRRNTPAWQRAYAGRIDQLIKGFKSKGAAVYFVGMPILRQKNANRMAKFINEIVRERVYLNGARFIDVYGAFANENGEYDRYGPDLTGKIRKLRDRDGETFTAAGNRKLAHFVAREIKRDLVRAKADRAVPLAGNKEDQQRINPQRRLAAAAIEKGWSSTVNKTRGRGNRDRRRRALLGERQGQQEDNARVSVQVVTPGGKVKSVSIEIVRPAIPAAIIALVTRKESANRASEIGDSVPGILQGGLTVLSTITPARDKFGTGGFRRLPPTHTLYYRVLIKGETLQPKAGRADDFRWPRPGMTAAQAQVPSN